jgi:type VI protein secretion system component VasK
MNRTQWLVWMVAGLVWLVFMTPRILVLQNGTEETQEQALITLGVFSMIVAVVAAGISHVLRSSPERRSKPRQAPVGRQAMAQDDLEQTRATDLLGPGAAKRRATRAAADRRRRSAS